MPNKTYDISKLPVWAQDKLKNAQYEIEKLQRQLEIAQNASTGGETNVYIYEGISDKTYLPEHSEVAFQLGETYHSAVTTRILTDVFGNRRLQINGNSGIAVLPRASNLVEIEIKE